MKIEVIIPEITLQTVIGNVISYDEDGDAVVEGSATVGDKVAAIIAKNVMAHPDYRSLQERVTALRDEEIREQLRPIVAEALQKPIQKTNSYGSPVGQPTTLTELIMESVTKYWNPNSTDRYGSRDQTLPGLIDATVRKELAAEIPKVVKATKDKALKVIAEHLNQPMMDAVREALK